jgi:hypothetical protein
MNSLDRKPSCRMVLHRILPSNSDDYHPSSYLSFLRLPSDQKREVGRLDTIAASGGWDPKGGRELKSKGRMPRSSDVRNQNEGA